MYKLTHVSNGIAEIEVKGTTSARTVQEDGVNSGNHDVQGVQVGSLNIDVATGLIRSAEIRQSLKCYIIVGGCKVPASISSTLTIAGRQQ